MKIKTETESGRIVTIIAFVVKYDNTYAVTTWDNGRLVEYPLRGLIVLN